MKHKIGRKKAIVIVALLILAVHLEVYAHTYVQPDDLPVITQEEALKIPYYTNATTVYSADGGKWQFVYSYWRPNHSPDSSSLVRIYIFKLQDNSAFPIQSVNVEPVMVTFNSLNPNRGLGLIPPFDEIFCENATVINQQFEFPGIGNYETQINLTFRIYRETPLGFIPGQEETIHFNSTFIYDPYLPTE